MEIEAYYLFPNSYIVKPGERLYIPVRKAWRAWSQHPMNSEIPEGTMACELLWQDASSLISNIDLTPHYSQPMKDSEIVVQTNASAGEGNAVVALTMNGEIVWSWHIWVTDYDPEPAANHYRY